MQKLVQTAMQFRYSGTELGGWAVLAMSTDPTAIIDQ
jgi:hypothetical protein